MNKITYLIVGSGLFGSVFAREATDKGYKVLVIDKRNHLGGNIYDEEITGLPVCKYGGHIFHTNDEGVWKYVNRFASFNSYRHRLLVDYKGNLFSFPINLYTLYKMWNIRSPEKAKRILERKRIKIENPQNFEEKVLSLVGKELYEMFYKGYTEKQWGVPCTQVPDYIADRIPIRHTFNDDYFPDKYQGMPIGGYTKMIEKMLSGIEVMLNEEFSIDNAITLKNLPCKILYTGEIDRLFDYSLGKLNYRSLEFSWGVSKDLGISCINYTQKNLAFTRQVNFNYFYPDHSGRPITMQEYPKKEGDPYYPVGDENSKTIHKEYLKLLPKNVIVGGRLGDYKYRNMDETIAAALELSRKVL